MRRGMGTGAAGYGKEKALTPISSATRGVPTHMLCSYSCLNWPLADSNGFWVRATSVIPFSISVVIFKKHTIFLAFRVTWLAKAPLLKISLHRAAVKPIKSFISSPMQTNPSMVVAASISQQIENKLVFLFWFDHGKVCSQILAKYPWYVPCWGRRCISNVVAGFPV